MSEIGVIPYFEIGMFGDIAPVYFVTDSGRIGAQVRKRGNQYFPDRFFQENIYAGSIVIGGGKGEHPAIAIQLLTQAVGRFIIEVLGISHDEAGSDLIDYGAFQPPVAIEYCHWKNRDHRNFYEHCSKFIGQHGSFTDFEIEDWLLLCVGRFVFESEIISNPVIDKWCLLYKEKVGRICDETLATLNVITSLQEPMPGPLSIEYPVIARDDSGTATSFKYFKPRGKDQLRMIVREFPGILELPNDRE